MLGVTNLSVKLLAAIDMSSCNQNNMQTQSMRFEGEPMTCTVYGPAFSYRDDGYIRFFNQAGRPERREAQFPVQATDWLITVDSIDVGVSSEPNWPVMAEDLRPDIRRLLAQAKDAELEAVHVSPLFACVLWLQGVLGPRNVDMKGVRRAKDLLFLAGSIDIDGRQLAVVVDQTLDDQAMITGHTAGGVEVTRLKYA